MDVDVSLSGNKQYLAALSGMADRSDNLEPFWESLDGMWRERQLAMFTASGRLAPLSPKSVRRKKINKNIPMLATGELRAATYRFSPVKSTADRATFGIPKGSGTVSGRGRKSIGAMHAVRSGSRPRRDVVPNWSKKERAKILEMLDDYILERGGKGRGLSFKTRWYG